MKIFQTYKTEKGKHQINRGLLWEYRLDDFDWQKYRRVVVERVILFLFLSCFSMFKSPTPTNSTHSWRPIVYSSAPSVTFRVDKGLVSIFLQANRIANNMH